MLVKCLTIKLLLRNLVNLTESERLEVEQHPQFGYDLIKDIESLPFTAKQIVLLHHEN